MLLNRLIVCFALTIIGLAIDLSFPLSCQAKDQLGTTTSSVLDAATSRKIYGSAGPQGSMVAPASRCPRVKPTLTITSTISSGTSTIPTSSGFTPVLSETYSVSLHANRRRQVPSQSISPMVVSVNPQGQVATSASELPQSIICGPTWTPSSTLTVPSYCPTHSTVTTTTTATVATSIIYDACSSDNLVNQGFGKGVGYGINSLTFYNVTSNTGIDVSTATECCAACQMLGCAYGGFLANPPFPYCELYFQDHCDPRAWLGNTFAYNPDIVGHLPPDLGFTVFNGPCGQIVYGGSSVCNDPPCM
ncbi:MAG: hypothetical protein L6R39_004819 [Caloplaca ligustica]|nr:MAG: hypothetical protein L6R39_004819 [Caloplaca ligustica]